MNIALSLALAVFISASQAAFAQDRPPEKQSFGPDTYRTGTFTGEGTTRARLDCEGSTSAGRLCTGFLRSEVDGTLLDATIALPPGSGPHPLVAILHGWGGSKDSLSEFADALLKDAHAVLRYSARGFGKSWGQVNLADLQVELADLRSMIGQVVDDGRLHVKADAVGVMGISYGGGQSWLALVQPLFRSPHGASIRIRTVVPIVPWTDLAYSLLPNGVPNFSLRPAGSFKLSFENALYLSGLRVDPERPYPNYADYLDVWHAWLNAMEPNNVDPLYRQIIDGVAGYRSIWWQEAFWQRAPRNRVAVFQLQGMTDDLFPLPEAKRMLLSLKTIDPTYPIASYFGDIGHPRAANKAGERAYVLQLIRDWFAYYLLESATAPLPQHVIRAAVTRPREQAFNSADVITVNTYGELAKETITKPFAGEATLLNPGGDPATGIAFDPVMMEEASELRPFTSAVPSTSFVPGTVAVYEVSVAEFNLGDLLIAGQPSVSLRATTTAPRVQLNVRLFDVRDANKELITRGTFLLEGPSVDVPLTIPTYGNLWQACNGHTLRLELTTNDAPYLSLSRVPSVTEISGVQLDMPIRHNFPACKPAAPA